MLLLAFAFIFPPVVQADPSVVSVALTQTTGVTTATTSIEALKADTSRKFVLFQNQSDTAMNVRFEPLRNGHVSDTEDRPVLDEQGEPTGETVTVPVAWEDSYRARVHTVDGSTPARHRIHKIVVSEPSRQFISAVIGTLQT